MEMKDRYSIADDDIEMYTECDRHPGEIYEVDSYCGLCFMEKRRRELNEEAEKIIADNINQAMRDIFGDGYSFKNQA